MQVNRELQKRKTHWSMGFLAYPFPGYPWMDLPNIPNSILVLINSKKMPYCVTPVFFLLLLFFLIYCYCFSLEEKATRYCRPRPGDVSPISVSDKLTEYGIFITNWRWNLGHTTVHCPIFLFRWDKEWKTVLFVQKQ